MARNELIYIEKVTVSDKLDDEGDPIKESTWREVFAEKKSIGSQEFYQAHSAGLQPIYKFVIHPSEYGRKTDGPHIKYNDDEYKIIRTYEVNSETLEITVEGDVHANA